MLKWNECNLRFLSRTNVFKYEDSFKEADKKSISHRIQQTFQLENNTFVPGSGEAYGNLSS